MDLFISYRRKDNFAAELIRDRLIAHDIDVFLDVHEIHQGDFRQNLEHNIDAASNFMLLLSPATWEHRSEAEIDYVREEIRIARRCNKHFILIDLPGYVEPTAAQWDAEDPDIGWLRNYDHKSFDIRSVPMQEASIKQILSVMVDEDGNRFTGKRKIKSANYYHEHRITDEDKLWVTTNLEVCSSMERSMFERIGSSGVFAGKRQIDLFCLNLYDPQSYRDRFESWCESLGNEIEMDIYGFCHDYDFEESERLFGTGHFAVCTEEDDYRRNLDRLLSANRLKGFDIIDMTLTLKDLRNPDAALDLMSRYVNDSKSILFIRELDDRAVFAYPDEKGFVPKMLSLLRMDVNAGCRDMGARLRTMLSRIDANDVFISDKTVSTANHKAKFCLKLCDAYFSYLLPEYRTLAEENPRSRRFAEALEWLESNYNDFRNQFRSREFYFRSGFMAGYCVIDSSNDEDDL